MNFGFRTKMIAETTISKDFILYLYVSFNKSNLEILLRFNGLRF